MRVPRLLAAILSLAATALADADVRAHPHVWITVTCEFVFDKAGRPIGLRETWVFDEMYSALAMAGIRPGRESAGALASLASTIVSASKDQGHFTTITLGGRSLNLSDPTEISAEWLKEQKLSVRFRLDFSAAGPLAGQAVRVEVHDPDLFADFRFDKDLGGAGLPSGCRTRFDDGDSSLPGTPDERLDALINGPLLMLSSGIELTCADESPGVP